jgi:hypothetical protein
MFLTVNIGPVERGDTWTLRTLDAMSNTGVIAPASSFARIANKNCSKSSGGVVQNFPLS